MKFTRKGGKAEFWNGVRPLPEEINVISSVPYTAEFELLTILGMLHGYVTAFDILTGSDPESEKDVDINAVLTAFQWYIGPKMPLSNYSSAEKRLIRSTDRKVVPIDANAK